MSCSRRLARTTDLFRRAPAILNFSDLQLPATAFSVVPTTKYSARALSFAIDCTRAVNFPRLQSSAIFALPPISPAGFGNTELPPFAVDCKLAMILLRLQSTAIFA
jgi:hypothetical protein